MGERNGETRHSLSSLFCTEERDYLIRKNGEKVKVAELEGKYVGIYFTAQFYWVSWRFSTPILSEIYEKLLEKGDFEIVYVSEEYYDKYFEERFQGMPWLAVPFSDKNTRQNLIMTFRKGFDEPCFTVLDKDGRVANPDGVEIIKRYRTDGYPFTAERLEELNASQTIESLLVSDERDYVLGHGVGRKVPVRELAGKTVALHFDKASSAFHSCSRRFNRKLVEIYNQLQERGEAFEIVFMPLDLPMYDNAFRRLYANFPWLTLPLGDKTIANLTQFFDLELGPGLIILGPGGRIVEINGMELIRERGIRGYPFTKERLDELEAEKKAEREAQTLESLLVSDEHNFVIKHGGDEVLVSELVGKTVALYLSAHWCPPCRGFTPELVKVYNELKERGEAFEIVFISSDENEEDFEEYYGSMPWLALPFGDERKDHLVDIFDVTGIPALIVIHPDGKTVTNTRDTVRAIRSVGAKAYPFTDAHLRTLEKEIEEHENAEAIRSVGAKAYPFIDAHLRTLEKEIEEHENADDAADEEYFSDGGYSIDKGPEEDAGAEIDEAYEEDAGAEIDEAYEEDADAAIDENNKPDGVICEGGVCYFKRR